MCDTGKQVMYKIPTCMIRHVHGYVEREDRKSHPEWMETAS